MHQALLTSGMMDQRHHLMEDVMDYERFVTPGLGDNSYRRE
jgi:hypothetical protein